MLSPPQIESRHRAPGFNRALAFAGVWKRGAIAMGDEPRTAEW